MSAPIRLDELEIVGYANVLKKNMLPAVVPPVFRFKAGGDGLLPPYRLSAGFVLNGTRTSAAEVAGLEARGEITLFNSPLAPSPDFEMWVDQEFGCRYEPMEEARTHLGGIASTAIAEARRALGDGDLEQAEEQASIAISANDRRVEPLAIKAAIRRIQQDRAGERLMASLAGAMLGQEAFQALVDSYVGPVAIMPPARIRPAGSPMKGMAAVPPVELAA